MRLCESDEAERAGFEPAVPVSRDTALAMLRKVQTVQSQTDSLALCLRSVLDSDKSAELLPDLERIVELWADLPAESSKAIRMMAEASHVAKGES